MRVLPRVAPAWIGGALVGALMLAGGPSQAAPTVIGFESPSSGFVGDLFNGLFGTPSPYIVASDGEAPFDPFSAGFDTSDGLNFSAVPHVWNQAPGSIWTQIGFQTWVLPADLTGIGCGAENEPTCEPTGHFISPDPWVPAAIGIWVISEGPGLSPGESDDIQTYNTAAGANLAFYSDPTLPEPATISLLGVGLVGLASIRWRRRG